MAFFVVNNPKGSQLFLREKNSLCNGATKKIEKETNIQKMKQNKTNE